MNRVAFLRVLRDGLAGLPAHEIDDILADYTAYFDEAHATGRSEEEVAAALGDPRRLARGIARRNRAAPLGKSPQPRQFRSRIAGAWRRSIFCSCCRYCSR
jgi:uncharacterized membrane protein